MVQGLRDSPEHSTHNHHIDIRTLLRPRRASMRQGERQDMLWTWHETRMTDSTMLKPTARHD
eukprot:106409-Pyramimonas_sp.AAC.1